MASPLIVQPIRADRTDGLAGASVATAQAAGGRMAAVAASRSMNIGSNT